MNIKKHPMAIEIPITKKPCIYFLTDEDGEIMYVGKSKSNILGRVSAHQYDKQFNKVFFINCSGHKEMDEMESKLIMQIKPKYNRMLNRKDVDLVSVGDIKKKIKIDVRFIKRAASEFNVGMVTIGSYKYYEKSIFEAIKKYVGTMKNRPLSLDYQFWKDCQ